MGCSFEPVIGVLRAGNEHKEFGDKFEFSATVVILDKEAFIKGATGKFSKKHFDEIKRMFAEMGLKKVIWERKKSGNIKNVIVEIEQ